MTFRCLVAAVPDPSASLGFRFDETIDSIQGAARSHGYVLERWRLPWSEPAQDARHAVASDAEKPEPKPEGTNPAHATAPPSPVAGDPGLLVFRNTKLASGSTDLLLVFLATESPTQGIDRLAFKRSLELARKLGEPGEPNNPAPIPVEILAPCFSGSMPSLRDALLDWLESAQPAHGKFHIEVVSGTASAFDRRAFLKAIRGRSLPQLGAVEFRSMTQRFENTLNAVLKFLGPRIHKSDVAYLSEIDTGFGQSVSAFSGDNQASREGGSPISLQYPSQVGEIRRRYESQGLMQDKASDVLRSAGDLPRGATATTPHGMCFRIRHRTGPHSRKTGY